MLSMKNNYADRDITVTVRELISGRDGETITLEPGESGDLEIDGDHQAWVSTRGRLPDEAAATEIPSLKKPEPVTELPAAGDEVVSGEMKDMIEKGENLTKGGLPELPALNQRLAALGFGAVDSARRASLMAAPT